MRSHIVDWTSWFPSVRSPPHSSQSRPIETCSSHIQIAVTYNNITRRRHDAIIIFHRLWIWTLSWSHWKTRKERNFANCRSPCRRTNNNFHAISPSRAMSGIARSVFSQLRKTKTELSCWSAPDLPGGLPSLMFLSRFTDRRAHQWAAIVSGWRRPVP